jgi:stearoyl-CoA desaturase (Delta-9 desaturase)
MTSVLAEPTATTAGPKPLTEGPQTRGVLIALYAFVILPFLAVLAAVPVAWGGWLSWTDIAIGAVFYVVSGLGITVGFHRYFTHGSFKAKRWLRVALALAGSVAIEGNIIQWVADHRRHHAFSDQDGDPHSPWRFGTGYWALTKGLFFAHVGWMFSRELSNRERFAPDLLADKAVSRVSKLFPVWTLISLFLPALVGGLWGGSLHAAAQAFFWAGLVRIATLHHVTWSINSICHTFGKRPFKTRDRSANVWPLALISMGESWHNLHHSDPTCARHGVLKGQVDTSAELIRGLEKLGLAWDVRWPDPERVQARLV